MKKLALVLLSTIAISNVFAGEVMIYNYGHPQKRVDLVTYNETKSGQLVKSERYGLFTNPKQDPTGFGFGGSASYIFTLLNVDYKPAQCSGLTLYKPYTSMRININADGTCVAQGVEKVTA